MKKLNEDEFLSKSADLENYQDYSIIKNQSSRGVTIYGRNEIYIIGKRIFRTATTNSDISAIYDYNFDDIRLIFFDGNDFFVSPAIIDAIDAQDVFYWWDFLCKMIG